MGANLINFCGVAAKWWQKSSAWGLPPLFFNRKFFFWECPACCGLTASFRKRAQVSASLYLSFGFTET